MVMCVRTSPDLEVHVEMMLISIPGIEYRLDFGIITMKP